MTIAFIVTLAALALVAGYAARQMQDVRDKDSTIEKQQADNEQQAITLERVRAENATLLRENGAHLANLKMVLDDSIKMDKCA